MASAVREPDGGYDQAAIVEGIYGDGIIGLKGAFSAASADRMREDIERLYEEARQVPGGAVPRGRNRYYVEVQPERIRGFVDIVTHPWFVAVCEAVLGPDYRIVEVGFDMPLPGSADQPWHRDFPLPEATRQGRLDCLAFNITAVDTTPEMGPFEIAPGTQWDDFQGCDKGMFPPRALWPGYAAKAVRKMPQRGDMSARTALTIHRGTANRSDKARPVLIVGVEAADHVSAIRHNLQISRAFAESLPPRLLERLSYQLVDEPGPVIQHHVIEGLLEEG